MRLRLLLPLIVLTIAGGTAEAQFVGPTPTTGTAQEEGPGVQVSDGSVLHPGIELEGGYDSNVFYQNPTQGPVGAPLLRSIIHFDWASLPSKRLTNSEADSSDGDITFRIRGYADYRHYFLNVTNPGIPNDFLGLGFSPHLTIQTSGNWNVELYDDYMRTSDPANQQVTPFGLTQDLNAGGFRLNFRPGGGTLSLGIGDSVNFEIFEANTIQFANNWGDTANAYAQWNFLPQTALRLEVNYGLLSFLSPQAGFTPESSNPLTTTLGLLGRLTPTITFNVNAGYGNSLTSAGEGYNMAIGGAQIGWSYAPQGKVSVGYSHGFMTSFFANVMVDDHFFLHAQQLLGTKFLLQGGVDLYLRDYLGVPMNPNFMPPGDRTDVIVEGHASLDYQIGEWLFTGIEYGILDDSTNFVSSTIPAAFDKQVILAKLDGSF